MGVDVKMYYLFGVKAPYMDVELYQNKNDSRYIEDLKWGFVRESTKVFFKDNLPDNFIVVKDSMGGEYTYFGFEQQSINDLYDGVEIQIDPYEFPVGVIQEIVDILKAFNIEIDEQDIKHHIFTHFT